MTRRRVSLLQKTIVFRGEHVPAVNLILSHRPIGIGSPIRALSRTPLHHHQQINILHAISHSIRLSTPLWTVQIFTILSPADSISRAHWLSVRSVDAIAIMIQSRLVVSCCAPVGGIRFSLISTLLYPGRRAGTRFDRIFWHISSGQSCRIECR